MNDTSPDWGSDRRDIDERGMPPVPDNPPVNWAMAPSVVPIDISIPISPTTTSFAGTQRWQSNGNNFWGSTLSLDQLPAGLYRPGEAPGIGVYLDKTIVDIDDIIDLPDSPSAEVIEEIRSFWKMEQKFLDRGFLFKRGVLLWGAPGSGKTTTLQQLISIVVKEYQGIGVFIENPGLASRALQMVRRIEPVRPLVVLIEDIDALVQRYGESEYLALLDGEAQVSNVVYVGTTNYPRRLDRRFVDRPSRFDLIKQIGMPTAAMRRAYLAAKEPSLTNKELVDWVRVSCGFSIAHLREMIILCKCYGRSLKDAVARLESMREGTPSEDSFNGNFGFTPMGREETNVGLGVRNGKD